MAHTLKKHHQTPPIPKTNPLLVPSHLAVPGPGSCVGLAGAKGVSSLQALLSLLHPGTAPPKETLMGRAAPSSPPGPRATGVRQTLARLHSPRLSLSTNLSRACPAAPCRPLAAPPLCPSPHLPAPPAPAPPRPARRAHGTGASTDTGTSTHSPRPDAPPRPLTRAAPPQPPARPPQAARRRRRHLGSGQRAMTSRGQDAAVTASDRDEATRGGRVRR